MKLPTARVIGKKRGAKYPAYTKRKLRQQRLARGGDAKGVARQESF